MPMYESGLMIGVQKRHGRTMQSRAFEHDDRLLFVASYFPILPAAR